MNILYYGNHPSINNLILDRYKKQNNVKHEYKRMYKNNEYYENSSFITISNINTTILEFVKDIVKTNTIHSYRRFVFLMDIHNIDFNTSAALRILLENYSQSTQFIATTTHISNIDKPIMSRFYLCRESVPLPSLHTKTPLYKINYRPTILEIHTLTKKCMPYDIRDIVVDLLNITVYKTQFAVICADLEHQYKKHRDKELCITNILLNCFYPPKTYKGMKKQIVK